MHVAYHSCRWLVGYLFIGTYTKEALFFIPSLLKLTVLDRGGLADLKVAVYEDG